MFDPEKVFKQVRKAARKKDWVEATKVLPVFELAARLMKQKSDFHALMNDAEEKTNRLQERCNLMEHSLRNRKAFKGRNTMQVANFSGLDHENMQSIGNFLKNIFNPEHKFPSGDALQPYTPDDPRSFTYKLERHLDQPDDIDGEVNWNENTLPKVNKKLIEFRSNSNTGTKGVFGGEWRSSWVWRSCSRRIRSLTLILLDLPKNTTPRIRRSRPRWWPS